MDSTENEIPGLDQGQLDALLAAHDQTQPDPETNAQVCTRIEQERCVIVTVKGSTVGQGPAGRLFSAIRASVDSVALPLVVDLTGCTFLSSFAIGEMASMARTRREQGLAMIVVGANDIVKDVIDLTGIGMVLTQCETQAQAQSFLDAAGTTRCETDPHSYRFAGLRSGATVTESRRCGVARPAPLCGLIGVSSANG